MKSATILTPASTGLSGILLSVCWADMQSCTFSCSQVPILFNMCSVDKLSDNSIQTVMYIKVLIRNCITGTVRKNWI